MYSAVGATGNGIQKITEYYALSALKDSVPTVWSENVPNLTATNKYLWNYEEILYTNGGTELTKKRIIGVYGDTGKDGAKGETGKDGKGIKSTVITYQASTSGTVIPTGTWQTSIPTVSAGQYLWTRTVITYTDDSKSTSYSVGRMGTNGTNGTSGSAGRGNQIHTHYISGKFVWNYDPYWSMVSNSSGDKCGQTIFLDSYDHHLYG